jgi:phenylalanyl-tRNA synthetase beta chain
METGHVFDHLGGLESTRLALATVGPGTGEDRFYELKGAVDHLAAELGITDLWFDDAEPFFADAAVLALTARGRCANIKDKNGKMLGFIGQVAPNAAASLRIKHAGAVVELDLRALVRHAQAEREYEPLPKYPAVERDISMFVSDEVRVRQILEAIHAADEAGLVRDVDVMDIFVPTGDEKLAPEYSRHEYGKSIAVRIVFRSDERTLTDEEVTVVEDTIKRALQDRVDARVR